VVNVRKRGGKEEPEELIASIRSLGIIRPLLVRPNCGGFGPWPGNGWPSFYLEVDRRTKPEMRL
jgi:ParB-like chromosome segregation protein Spo0J